MDYLSEKICRGCTKSHERFYDLDDYIQGSKINETESWKIRNIFALVNPQLSEDNGLPQQICSVCFNKLIISYKFQQLCNASEAKLLAAIRESMKEKSSTHENHDRRDTLPDTVEEIDFEACDDIRSSDEKFLPLIEFKSEECTEDTIRDQNPLDCNLTDAVNDRTNKTLSSKAKNFKHLRTSKYKKITRKSKRTTCKRAELEDSALPSDESTPPNNKEDEQKDTKIVKKRGRPRQPKKLKTCKICNKEFPTKNRLNNHLVTHSDSKEFLCPECGKGFKTRGTMQQHQLRHKEKTYECDQCPMKFHCRSGVTKHMSVHLKVKAHVCDICGAKCSRSYSLIKHKLIHSETERNFLCQICGMAFVTPDRVRRHQRTHAKQKLFKCQYCDNAYSLKADLKKHLSKHIGEKFYVCDECPESFKYQVELLDHKSEHFKAKQLASSGKP